MSIKKSMKIAMAQCGINQQELAVASGITEATISRIAKGRGSPSFDTIKKLAKATDCTVMEFITLGEK